MFRARTHVRTRTYPCRNDHVEFAAERDYMSDCTWRPVGWCLAVVGNISHKANSSCISLFCLSFCSFIRALLNFSITTWQRTLPCCAAIILLEVQQCFRLLVSSNCTVGFPRILSQWRLNQGLKPPSLNNVRKTMRLEITMSQTVDERV